jgi:hypothetical protein
MGSNGEILRRSGGFAASVPQNDNPLRQAASGAIDIEAMIHR